MIGRVFGRSLRIALLFAFTLSAFHTTAQAQTTPSVAETDVDAIFSKWSSTTPGCAIGVSVDGSVVLEKAYGMADLEHDVPNTPDTIFEAGSVSKQFTAAAVLLLAQNGKLSLDDPVRQYIPELPDYDTPITIRQMLQHTSGLRDWGHVAAIAGWPRTSRAHTHAHVLDIVSRQRSLNFEPGTRWSYSNTGYNLAAILVSRVSGKSFAEFTRKHIFEPLGMTRTSWRDDFTRVVQGRSVAYKETDGEFYTNMPFENVHGNGGLLTTVGDLLRWNENFVDPTVGDAKFIRQQQTPGRLNDGLEHIYGLGLRMNQHKGLPEVWHTGGTAGYRAFLARYPDQYVSVALLCNASSAPNAQYGRAVADLYLGNSLNPETELTSVRVSSADLDARVGMYRNTTTGVPFSIVRDDETLRIEDGNAFRVENGTPLIALSSSRFGVSSGSVTVMDFDDRGRARLTMGNNTSAIFEKVPLAQMTRSELSEFEGSYVSDEAEVTMQVVVRDGALVLERRPDTTITLTPLYSDAFTGSLGTVLFHRDASGQVVEFSVVMERVWDLRFQRNTEATD